MRLTQTSIRCIVHRCCCLLVVVSWWVAAHPVSAPPNDAPDNAFESVLTDLCDREIVLLGEASHGDARMFEVKTRLAERLITKCGFTGFFIESGVYDGVALNRKIRLGEAVSAQMVRDFIGGIWTPAAEIRPLIDLLLRHAERRDISIGGLDDQVSATAHFAHNEMIAELVSALADKDKNDCARLWKQFLAWNYDTVTPFSTEVQTNLRACVARMQVATAHEKQLSEVARDERLLFLRNLDRYAARQRIDRIEAINSRDESMYLNLNWLRGRMTKPGKIIVWTHNVHAANSLAGSDGLERRLPLGEHVRKRYGSGSYALGFSALSGQYSNLGRAVKNIAKAPPNSVEAQILSTNTYDARFISRRELIILGRVPAAIHYYDFREGNWGDSFDGLYVFREERAPQAARD